MSNPLNDWRLVGLFCLTLGLMPYNDPHIIGKVQWVWGGAVGMKPIDWWDFIMHGTPWVLAIRLATVKLGGLWTKRVKNEGIE